MRGKTVRQVTMLSATTPDDLVPQDHPIRRIKPVVEAVLSSLGPTLDRMYAKTGRLSVPPEHLLKASVLMALFSIRSERQFCEQLRFNLLLKWFLDLNTDDPGFDHSSFSKNRQGCWNTMSPTTSSPSSWSRHGCVATSPMITSTSTARCWSPGHR